VPAQPGECDDDLLQRARAGDRPAFEALYERHFRSAYAVAYRLADADRDLAADAAQDVFVTLVTGASGYRGAGQLRAYLLQCVVNYVRQQLRRRRTAQRCLRAAVADVGEPEAKVITAAAGEAARQALRRLPAEQREVIVLRVYQGLRFAEIAEITGCPVDTAKSRYRRGVERLRHALASWGEEGGTRHEP